MGRLLDAASPPLYVLDEDRKIVFFNAAFRRWLGQAADELVGRVAPTTAWGMQRQRTRSQQSFALHQPLSQASDVPA